MTRISEVKTNFTAGAVSEDLLGRGDLRAYDNGARVLKNVFIKPTGGVTRRSGLNYIDTAQGEGRLIAFEFNTEQTYLLVVTDENIAVYAGGVKETDVASPWTTAQINQLAWTQSADTLLLSHPDTMPKKLTRSAGGTWSLNDWEFFEQDGVIYQPYFKFEGSAVTLTPSATTGTITLTSSTDVFTAAHENTRLRVGGKEVLITDFDSATVVTADTIEDLAGTDATIDWQEQAFSPARGYPTTIAFHQDRLVIGGSRDLPNRLWFSKSGDLFNFDLGEGLDDESIEFSILSDQVNAIRGLFSGRHLQVFTSGAEWMVTGDPLTPTSVQIRRQTRTGSLVSKHVPPVNVDGATFYIARSGEKIHEFIYTDLEQAYSSTDIVLLAEETVGRPIDQDYDSKRRLLFVVRDDGKFATLTIFRAEAVSAWTIHETQGNVKAVCVVGDEVYMLVSRNGEIFIEVLDDALNLDAALTGEVGSPATVWSGLDHLEGLNVTIKADGIASADTKLVSSGSITLDEPASTIETGLPYTHIIEPMPPSEVGRAGGNKKIRLVKAIFRLQNTQAFKIDVGRGLKDIPLRDLDEPILDTAPEPVTGDITVQALGWKHNGIEPLWHIEQDAPYNFTLLSVTEEIKVSG